jgi:hypothetical protein
MSSLAILVQYRLVKFTPLETNENLSEYVLLHERVLLFLRYPRYIYFINKKYGNLSALLVEELLKSGMGIAQSIIARAYSNSDVKNDKNLQELRDSFLDLIQQRFIYRCPNIASSAANTSVDDSKFIDIYKTPEIDLRELKTIIETGSEPSDVVADKTYWTINFDKFHQCFRDKALVEVIERQIDANAGECFQHILTLMYNKTEPW